MLVQHVLNLQVTLWLLKMVVSNVLFTLGLVDGHRKARADRELGPFEAEGKVTRDDGNPWDENVLTLCSATEYCGLNEIRPKVFHHHPCTIDQCWRVKVPEEHDCCPNLKLEVVRWHTRGLLRIEKLNRVIHWTPEWIEYEADQRHAELVVKGMG